jgi:hypothetical protein
MRGQDRKVYPQMSQMAADEIKQRKILIFFSHPRISAKSADKSLF